MMFQCTGALQSYQKSSTSPDANTIALFLCDRLTRRVRVLGEGVSSSASSVRALASAVLHFDSSAPPTHLPDVVCDHRLPPIFQRLAHFLVVLVSEAFGPSCAHSLLTDLNRTALAAACTTTTSSSTASSSSSSSSSSSPSSQASTSASESSSAVTPLSIPLEALLAVRPVPVLATCLAACTYATPLLRLLHGVLLGDVAISMLQSHLAEQLVPQVRSAAEVESVQHQFGSALQLLCRHAGALAGGESAQKQTQTESKEEPPADCKSMTFSEKASATTTSATTTTTTRIQ
mmetsp:Transcript_50365/g.126432  ORF Transcript_50365/g.126432 Transcript_50365/m.126432 type:complete len:290 (+) Transcript_50365:136-1005(+)